MIDRWIGGQPLDGFDLRLPVVDKAQVLARQKTYRVAVPADPSEVLSAAPVDFREVELPMTEAEARRGAGLCLDCGVCSECGECVDACPVESCIDLRARDQVLDVDVGAVVVATGLQALPADLKPEYGFGTFKNVITGMQMDRLLAPTRPFNTILRPGDGKVPERIAYVMCTGSRDETVGNPLCSRFCCMYSIKQNQLIMGALPVADVTVHYMDIRAPGKRYDEFYEQAKAMGANYVKGRVAKITEKPNGDLVLRYEDIEHGGGLVEAEYDLVVLAVGVQPNSDAQALFPEGALVARRVPLRGRDRRGRQPGPDQHPRRLRGRGRVGRQGHRRLDPARRLDRRPGGRLPGAREGAGMTASERRIGVYVCHCGGNISDHVDVDQVVAAAQGEPGVVVARQMMFACSDAGQGEMERDIEEQHLDGLVVASCSPKLHVVTFRGVAKRAGLNPYEYTQVNVREQASWVQSDDQQQTTNKVINLVKAGIARTRLTDPLEPIVVETTQKTLVVGGGVAGLRAAIGLADIGLGVFLVEREAALGGWVGRFDADVPDRQERPSTSSPN